jgi:hypothetical protein
MVQTPFALSSKLWQLERVGQCIQWRPYGQTENVIAIHADGRDLLLLGRDDGLSVTRPAEWRGKSGEAEFFERFELTGTFAEGVSSASPHITIVLQEGTLYEWNLEAENGDPIFALDSSKGIDRVVMGERYLFVLSSRLHQTAVRMFSIQAGGHVSHHPSQLTVSDDVLDICEFGDALLVVAGNAVLLYVEHDGVFRVLSRTDRFDALPDTVIPLSDSCFCVHDQKEVIRCLRYHPEMHAFEVIGILPLVRKMAAWCPYGNSITCTDAHGNLLIYRVWEQSLRHQCMVTDMAFHVGESITGVCVKSGNLFRSLCYAAFNGAVGCLVAVTDTGSLGAPEYEMAMKELKHVETAMAQEFFILTGSDFVEFRNKCYPCGATVDLDLLSFYSSMLPITRSQVSARTPSQMSPERIDQLIASMECIVASIH